MSKQKQTDHPQLQMLKEMLESMADSLENQKTIVKQQYDLIELIENSEKKKDFEEFVKGVKENAELMTRGIARLENRIIKLDYVVDCTESSEEIKDVAEALLEGLGVFSK